MRRLGGFLLIVGLVLIGVAAPAHAELTENTIGCAGSAVVRGDDGSSTSVNAEDASVTLSDTSGEADYEGSVQTITHNHSGEIRLEVGLGALKVATWESENDGDEASKSGVKVLPSETSNVPPGKYELTGFHEGDEGRCAGKMTVEVTGSILSNPISAGTVGLAVLFLLVFLFGIARGRPILAGAGGLLFGFFGGLDLVFARAMGSGSVLLVVLPVVLLVLGVVVAFLIRRAGSGPDAPVAA
jgi:hypothetical protein